MACDDCPGADDCSGCEHEPKPVDPWEMLRNVAKTLHRRNVDNARWYDVMIELDRIDEALKQHDERKNDGK